MTWYIKAVMELLFLSVQNVLSSLSVNGTSSSSSSSCLMVANYPTRWLLIKNLLPGDIAPPTCGVVQDPSAVMTGGGVVAHNARPTRAWLRNHSLLWRASNQVPLMDWLSQWGTDGVSRRLRVDGKITHNTGSLPAAAAAALTLPSLGLHLITNTLELRNSQVRKVRSLSSHSGIMSFLHLSPELLSDEHWSPDVFLKLSGATYIWERECPLVAPDIFGTFPASPLRKNYTSQNNVAVSSCEKTAGKCKENSKWASGGVNDVSNTC